MMNPPPSQMMNQLPPPSHVFQSWIMNQTPLVGQSQGLHHPIIDMNQQQQQVLSLQLAHSQSHAMMNNQPLMMDVPNCSPNPNLTNRNNYCHNWEVKKMEQVRRMHNSGGYRVNKHPNLNEFQSQNRKFDAKKKKYGKTSFIIRAKKSGGIAELVSPCPVTPSVFPTPTFSPSREALGDMAKEEWGVDGYGSMKGLIRLRSDGGHELEPFDDNHDDDEDEGGSCESELDEHVEVERRLDQDLSRFEIIYPNHNVLENRVDDQDSHIAQLEEDSLTMKEKLSVMEMDFGEFRRRLQYLEMRYMVVGEDGNGEVVENESESFSERKGSDVRTSGESETKVNNLAVEDVCMEDVARDDSRNEINNAK